MYYFNDKKSLMFSMFYTYEKKIRRYVWQEDVGVKYLIIGLIAGVKMIKTWASLKTA